MTSTICWVFVTIFLSSHAQQILEDARVHPTGDGTFGFLYRTQDGIAHAAKGDPGGAVHGRFTYTDPTGLKVNFNYNAGAQAVRAKQEPPAQAPVARPRYVQQEQSYPQEYEQNYQEPRYEQSQYEPRYEPSFQPKARPRAIRPQPRNEEPLYEEPVYEQPAPRRPRPEPRNSKQNYVYDEYDQNYPR